MKSLLKLWFINLISDLITRGFSGMKYVDIKKPHKVGKKEEFDVSDAVLICLAASLFNMKMVYKVEK